MQKVCGRTPFAKRHRDSNTYCRTRIYRFRHQLQRTYASRTDSAMLLCSRFLHTQLQKFSQPLLECPYRNGYRKPRDYDFQQIGVGRKSFSFCHSHGYASVYSRSYAYIAQRGRNTKCLHRAT